MAKEHEVEIVTFVMGIVVASTLHIIADKVNTRRKKMMRKRRNVEDKKPSQKVFWDGFSY